MKFRKQLISSSPLRLLTAHCSEPHLTALALIPVLVASHSGHQGHGLGSFFRNGHQFVLTSSSSVTSAYFQDDSLGPGVQLDPGILLSSPFVKRLIVYPWSHGLVLELSELCSARHWSHWHVFITYKLLTYEELLWALYQIYQLSSLGR